MLTIEFEPAVVNSIDRYLTWRSVWARVQEVVTGALRELVNGVLDDEVTVALGREHRARRAASGEVELPWGCRRCGTRGARDFERDGHYPRQLQTTGASLAEVRVPMLECKVCGGAAEMEFAALPKHQQLWLDIDAEVLFAYGTEEGLRHIGDRVGRALGWPVSPASIQRRVHQLQAAVEAWHQERIADPPDVLMIDGLWFTTVLPTGARFADRRGRDRPQVAKAKRVALVVLGLWSKTGRREVLDFQIAAGEDEATVVQLLNRLHDRGVTEARLRLQALIGEWLTVETEAVACLVTDFETSIAYLTVPGLDEPHRFCTINPLEGGVMRPLRRKVDHATAFRSQTGAEVTLFLAIQRLNAHQRRQPWSHAADRLLQTYLNLNP